MLFASSFPSLQKLEASSVVVDRTAPIILEFKEQVLSVVFSPFEWSHELVLIGFLDKIKVAQVKFQEENEEQTEPVKYASIQEVAATGRIYTMAWSPSATSAGAPMNLTFASTGINSFNISVYNSDGVEPFNCKELTGHENLVNALAYQHSGEYLASVSDDLTCRLWAVDKDYSEVTKFNLISPGTSVCWHGFETNKLIVGEQCGTIRMYNVSREAAILSLRTDISPLNAIDWSPTDPEVVASFSGGYLFVWRTSTPSSPKFAQVLHPNGGRLMCFSDQKVVTIGAPDNTLKVTDIFRQSSVKFSSFKVATSLSPHLHLPYVAVAVDNTIQFWDVSI